MNAAHNLKNSCLLWLPSYLIEDDEAITDVTNANGTILDFLDGEIKLAEAIERLDEHGIGVDDYLRALDQNLDFLGA